MTSRNISVALIIPFALIQPHLSTCAQDASPRQIVRAWQERESTATSVRIVWDEVYSKPLQGAELHTSHRQHEVSMSGSQFRWERPILSSRGGRASTLVPLTTTFDGVSSQSFSKSANQGGMKASRQFEDLRVISLRPVLLLFRPLVILPGAMSEDHVHVESQETINDTACYKVRIVSEVDPRVTNFVWCAADGSYLPLRNVNITNGKTVSQTDIFYSSETGAPSSIGGWKATLMSESGRLQSSAEATVQACAISSEPLDIRFNIDFPRGAVVFDRRSGKEEKLVSLGDGKFRRYLPSDANHRSTWPWLAVGSLVFLPAIVIVFFMWRRRMRR